MTAEACSTKCTCVSEVERNDHQVGNNLGTNDSLTNADDVSRKVTDRTITKSSCECRTTTKSRFYRRDKKQRTFNEEDTRSQSDVKISIEGKKHLERHKKSTDSIRL